MAQEKESSTFVFLDRLTQTDIVLMGVIAGMTAFLDFVGVVTFPVGIGASAFYVGAAFYVGFALWFGWRGLAGMYVGLLIGALITGRFSALTFVFAWTNVIGAAVVMFLFQFTLLSPTFDSVKDYAGYITGAILYSVITAAYFFGGNDLFGLIPGEAILPSATAWIIGDMVVILLIGIPLIKGATPVVRNMEFASSA